MIKRLKLLLNTKRACIGKGTAAIAKTAPTNWLPVLLLLRGREYKT